MEPWKLRISDERAESFKYLFHLLREHDDKFLSASFIEPITRLELIELMDWFEEAYDMRKARKAVKERWET